MKKQIFCQVIKKALRGGSYGSHKVKVIFKPDSINDIAHLLLMINSGSVSLTDRDTQMLMDVVQLHKWNGDRDRAMIITLTDKFNEEWFFRKLRDAIENI